MSPLVSHQYFTSCTDPGWSASGSTNSYYPKLNTSIFCTSGSSRNKQNFSGPITGPTGGDSIYYYATAAYAELVYDSSDCPNGIEKVSFSYHMNGLYHGYTDKRYDGVIYSGPLSVVASSVVWSKRGDQGQSETAWNAADVHLDGASSFKFVFQFGTAYAPMVEAIGNVAVKCRNPIATALDYIVAHNAKRALHQNTPDLVYDATLAAGAQAHADTCPMIHSTDDTRSGAGENLHWSGASGPTVPVSYADVVGDWYAEIGNYLWPATATGAVSNGSVVGHFTQVVWKGTTKVGCGYNTVCHNVFASDGLTNNAVVCWYSPAGNTQTQYVDNVMPLKTPTPTPTGGSR